MIKIVKRFKKTIPISYTEDRATADFRGFHKVALIHATRVQNPLVIEVMLEILEDVRKTLQHK